MGTCDCGGIREFRGSAERDWRYWRVTSRLPEQPVRKLIKRLLLDARFVRLHLAAFAVTGAALARSKRMGRRSAAAWAFVAWGAALVLNLAGLFSCARCCRVRLRATSPRHRRAAS